LAFVISLFMNRYLTVNNNFNSYITLMFNKDINHVLLCCGLKAQTVGFQQPNVEDSLSYTHILTALKKTVPSTYTTIFNFVINVTFT
jgi:hypothetical protein